MNATDTIAAIATPQGQGGVGIIRVSGPKVQQIAQALIKTLPEPRVAHLTKFENANGEILDHGLALFFKAPYSFTGEDVLELQGHGGPVILDRVLKAVLKAGARLAEPGEFSKRAFLNDKIDLAQAEAIADLISAQSEEAARAAMRSLEGEFSHEIHALVEALTHLRMFVEAAIDFPEEEIDFLSDGRILNLLNDLLQKTRELQKKARQGSLLREGMTVVITGQPNAGKSSLLNALSGQESAIVTNIAGTTRDILKEKILIDGMPLHILDTAGLRESNDPIEQEGIKRAKAAIQKAQAVLLVIDLTRTSEENIEKECQDIQALVGKNIPVLIVLNKIDQASHSTAQSAGSKIFISAKTHEGLDLLKQKLKAVAGAEQSSEGVFLARRRHLEAIEKAYADIQKAYTQLTVFKAGELVAEELRQAQLALSEITGKFTSDDLLGKIFGSFCIGK